MGLAASKWSRNSRARYEQTLQRPSLISAGARGRPDERFTVARGLLELALAQRLSATELVELTAVVAGYNMVARFLVALQVPPGA